MLHQQKFGTWKILIMAIMSVVVTIVILKGLSSRLLDKELGVLGLLLPYPIMGIGLYLWFFRKSSIFSKKRLRFSWKNELVALFPPSLALALFSVGSVYLVYVPMSWFWPEFVDLLLREASPILGVRDSENPIIWNAVLFAATITIVPVVEEVVFRGILYSSWRARIGHIKAMMASSLLFSMLHFNGVGSFVISLVAFALMFKTGSLIAPMLFHATYNFVAFLIALLLNKVTGVTDALTLEIFREFWWLGVTCLVVSTPFVAIILHRRREDLRQGER